MLNHVTIMGRLTKDPELRTAGETPVCSFRIACDRDFKNKDGGKEADFIDVVVWRKLAENMAVVDGRLQIRPWTDKDGEKRYSTEIVADHVYFGDSKRTSEGGSSNEPPVPTDVPEGFVPNFDEDEDGDLPF